MESSRTTYRAGFALAVGTGLFLIWSALAMGVNGREGDPFDRIYLAVLAVGIVGALVARFQPGGMVRTLLATAAAQALVVVIALIAGKQDDGATSVLEIVAVNGFFILMFLASAWLFGRSAGHQGQEGRAGRAPVGGSDLQT